MIPAKILPVINFAGCLYILYIAVRVAKTPVNFDDNQATNIKSLTFSNGLFMQLLNRKALAATLPITTIQFPAAGIAGSSIVLWSCILALLAFGAPSNYSLAGRAIGKHMTNAHYFEVINLLMAALLVVVAADIAVTQIFIQ
ncbi:transporter [Pseudoalteromonas haloplanktis]|uniref:Transporter n=1 Tax=Pseudoalteromonas haloplanktis TaxID=228 RepID=A0ABU1B9F1_PSEHA|nr:transporter [Pseudoalteromonas haloplanktis]MDQ9090887.1 transporter [Pseudoalteromonas haloplanktis]